MKKSHDKIKITLLILMTMWTGWLLFTWVIPSLLSEIRFANNIKYEIIGGYGYVSEYIQTTICQFQA